MSSPTQVLVRGLSPALNAPVDWEPAGCRAFVGGTQRGSGWEAQILHPTLMSEALDPKLKAGKIEKPPVFPIMPPPSVREKAACTEPAPRAGPL